MRRVLFLSLGLALSMPVVAGCGKEGKGVKGEAAEKKPAEVPVMTIDEAAVALAKGDCRAVDANDLQLRKDVGVIPGAVLLTDFEAFSLKELPDDKAAPLVFYCANEQCDASHIAARRARSAGYQQVHVLAAGIMGWAKAGKPLDRPELM